MTGWRLPRVVLLAVAVVAVLAFVAIGRPGWSHYAGGGIEFDYPAGWDRHDPGPTTGLGQTLVIVGTASWGLCAPWDVNCHYQQRLGPGQLEIQVGVGMAIDFCAYAKDRPDLAARTASDPPVSGNRYFRIAGRPAYETDFAVNGTDYYGSDGWREYRFATADSSSEAYDIQVMWRGPGSDAMLDAVDRLVASIRLSPRGGGPPGDCGAPFPAA